MTGHADVPYLPAEPVRGLLVIGAALVAMIIAITTAVIIWIDRESDLVSAERELSRLSLTLAETTLRTIQSLDLILIGLQENIAEAGVSTSAALADRFSSSEFHDRMVERTRNISQLDAVVLLNDQAQVINSSRSPAVPAPFDLSGRDYFIAHKSRSELGVHIGRPVRNRVTGEWTMFVSRRVEAPDGTFLGILNAVVKTEFFESLFQAVTPGEAATVSLFRRDGVLLARHPTSESVIGRSFPMQSIFAEAISKGGRAVIRTPPGVIDDTLRVMAPTAVDDYPLIVNVTNSNAAILAVWVQKSIVTSVIAAAACGLVLLFGILFGRQLNLRMRIAKSLAEREEAARGERKIRKLAEDLEKSLKQLRAVTDHLPVLIAYVDRDMKFRFINKTAEIWYGRGADKILGYSIADILERPPTASPAELFESLAKGPVRDVRTRKQPDGTTRTLDVIQVPDFGADGKVCGYYALLTDITDRMATEAQLRQAQKLDAIGKLTGGIAHDFNNLLAIILGNLELAKEAAAGGIDPSNNIDVALRATDQGAELTRSLLSFARQQSLSPKSLKLSELVGEMIALMRRTIPENISIDVFAAKDLWACHADPSQVKNALLNLILNGRDAMPSGGRMMIETANVTLADEAAEADIATGDYVMLAVSDTGAGMPPSVVAQAFEPFFTTKEIGHGTGLGLSMVYGFAKQSNGNVKIYSEVGHGTVVKLYLPRSNALSDNFPETQQAAPLLGKHNETVLVVEDNADVRRLTAAMLTSLSYRVLDCENPREALAKLAEEPAIDLLLTDVVLSDSMNGPQLAAAARDMKPALKLLFMSGYTENALKHSEAPLQSVRLLQKPFRKQDLARAVRQALAGES